MEGEAGALRVAVVAPPWFELPPSGYGGIEWMTYWLAEGLAGQGHDVTLIGAGAARTRARFLRTYATPPTAQLGQVMPELVQAAWAASILQELDVDLVHSHAIAHPLTAAATPAPTVVTVHGPPATDRDLATYLQHLARSGRVHLVAISEHQRRTAPHLPWAGLVHNAIAVGEYPFNAEKEDWCLWLGRMSPEKAPDLAIKAAREAGMPIVLAGKCNEPSERRYFARRVRPLLGPDARWLGEAGTGAKKDLLARARCLVFPVQWEEPFGLVMVEAMACGTPVVGLRRGAVPEIVADGVTGFVRDRPEDLPAALRAVDRLEPKACRQHAADHFDLPRMIAGYESVYRAVLSA